MQIQPASAQLGRMHAGKQIGYRVLTSGRAEYRPFTMSQVVETLIPGTFSVIGGIEAPDAGGHIVWGTKDQDIAEADIPAIAPDMVTPILTALRADLESLIQRIAAMIPAPPDLESFAAGIAEQVNQRADEMRSEMAAEEGRVREKLESLTDTLVSIREMTDSLTILQDGAQQVLYLAEMRNRLNSILGDNQPSGLKAVTEMSVQPLTSAISALSADMAAFVDKVEEGRKADDARLRSVAALDKFLKKVSG